jgi:hypothetical protein
MSELAPLVAKLAERWMRRTGLSSKNRGRLCALDMAVGGEGATTEERVLRAAACDLYDTLCATP